MAEWIKVDASYRSHPKTLRLRKLLGPGTQWYPIALWSYCAEVCPSGELAEDLIEDACEWTGKKGRLLDALKACGFVDEGGVVHGWMERSGAELQRISARREADRHRKSGGSLAEAERISNGIPKELRRKVGGSRARDRAGAGARAPVHARDRGEKEKEKEKEKLLPSEEGHPPSEDAPGAPARGAEGELAKNGKLSAIGRQLAVYVDAKLRARGSELALPRPLPAAACICANTLAKQTDPDRLKYTVWWAFQDVYWQQHIADLCTLKGAWPKLLSQSAKTWQELQHERDLWDEPPRFVAPSAPGVDP